MKEYISARVITLAEYIIDNQATVRAAAKKFALSKSLVHKDVTVRLSKMDPVLAQSVKNVLDHNKAERHIRGGMATKLKYEKKRTAESK
ncbi:MAG: sporulation transcriptional regulator SpoIIID [Clostridia bacterium]|nr:sporulation transcriptional regulator SpoIIID [Clostridia bacterium]